MDYQEMFEKNERSESFYFAAGLAAYGMLLRQSPYKGDATYDMAKELIGRYGFTIGNSPTDYRAELLQLIEKAEKQAERLQ